MRALLLAGASAIAQAPQAKAAQNPTAALTPVTRRDAARPAARRLADVAPHLQRLELQPARPPSCTIGVVSVVPVVSDHAVHPQLRGQIQALNGATGDLIWEYKRDLSDWCAIIRTT